MVGKIKKARPTRRDAEDAAVLKLAGNPAHINLAEDRLLAERMPQSHGKVITRGLLAEAGRRGDDRVTRLTPAEADLLKRSGGAGTRNPRSGMLEFWGGETSDSPGTAGGGGGEGGDNGVGGPGNGSAGTGPGQGPGPGQAGYGGDYGGYNSGVGFGFSNYNEPGLSYGGISNFGGIGQPGSGSIGRGGDMSNFASYAGAMTDAGIEAGYAPLDTVSRLVQNMIFGPPPAIARGVPGRYGAPNAKGPGVMGTMVSTLAGQPMGMAMSLGRNMQQSMSKEAQDKSLAETQATGAQNSGGNQGNHSVLAMDELMLKLRGANAAGSASGASTTGTPPPGYMLNPAGQIVPMAGSNNRAAWRDPVENLLYDYVWRGPSGRGW